MPKSKKETAKSNIKKKHEPPVSLHPLTFEQAMKGLLQASSKTKNKESTYTPECGTGSGSAST